jgi:hypothetical protein
MAIRWLRLSVALGATVPTRIAMRQGAAAIAQAALTDGRWFGRADVLRRVERQWEFGRSERSGTGFARRG